MRRLTTTQLEIAGKIGTLSGTAAKILAVFLLSVVGQSFTGQDFADMFGVSANTITPAIRQLSRFGFLQHNGKLFGWSLIPEYRQMALAELIQKNLDDPKIFGSTPTLVVSSGLVSSDLSQGVVLTNQPTNAVDPNFFGSTPIGPENTAPTPENEVCDSENTAVAYWLEQGGIIRDTPNWRFLVQKTPSPEYAKAHVLQFLSDRRAWVNAGKKDREPGTGALIYRLRRSLERNAPPPPMRCADCLLLERECDCDTRSLDNQIPDHLRDIIRH